MNKKDVKKLHPDALCEKWKNGRFYIYDGANRVPVFPHGHSTARKAWADLQSVLEDDLLQFGV